MTREDRAFCCELARRVIVGVSNMIGAASPENDGMIGHWAVETVRMIDALEARDSEAKAA